MPHFHVRYTRAQNPVNVCAGTYIGVQVTEVLCAENLEHTKSMLGNADHGAPILIAQTKSPVTVGRYCVCQRP